MKNLENVIEKATKWDKEKDLQYFESMQNSILPGTPCHTAAAWNQRAKLWEKEFADPSKDKGQERILSTVEYLQGRGALKSNDKVVDIGCGPGRFTAEFAKYVEYALGLDISEQMLQMGRTYIDKEGLNNAFLKVCDFQEMDIAKEQMEGKFDLVFSSITPAINGIAALEKAIKMSKKYCLTITHIYSNNELQRRILKEVFGHENTTAKDGYWFYSLFNTLFLRGYYPETSYYLQHKEKRIEPSEEYANYLMQHILPTEEHTVENKQRIEEWMNSNTEADGQLSDVGDTWYGRILWDVRIKTDRQVRNK